MWSEALVRVLHTLSQAGHRTYEVLSETRGSGVLCADETGAREDGLNGYMWSLCTPSVRYYGPPLSEYGQLLTTASRLLARGGSRDWLRAYVPQLRLIAEYVHGLVEAGARTP